MIKAVWDAIIVKVDEKTEKMHGKFIIPDLSQEKAIIGTIIDVGPGRWNNAGDTRIPMSFKVGDKVVVPPYHQGQDIKMNGKSYLILRESELLMVIR